jgi:hypothetical protein
MRKSHFNDEFLVLLRPIISRFFEEKNKQKQQRVCALVLSLWGCHQSFYVNCLWPESTFIESSKKYFSLTNPAEAKVPLTLAKFATLSSNKNNNIAVYDSYLRWFLGNAVT